MRKSSQFIAQSKAARVAGFAYLMVILGATPSQLFVRSKIVITGDPAATVENILASEWLFRLAFAADLVAFSFDIVLAIAFYILLKPISKTLSLIAAAFRIVMVSVFAINMLHHFMALIILNDGGAMSSFQEDQQHSLVAMFMTAHTYGYLIGMVFFGVSTMLLGYLFYKSRYIPRVLSAALFLGALILVIGIFGIFLFPEYGTLISPGFIVLDALAEWSLCLWLIFMGVKIPSNKTA